MELNNLNSDVLSEISLKLDYNSLIAFFISYKLSFYNKINWWKNYLDIRNIKYHENNNIKDLKRLSYLYDNFCFDTELESYFIFNNYINKINDFTEKEKLNISKDFIKQVKTDIFGYCFGRKIMEDFETFLFENNFIIRWKYFRLNYEKYILHNTYFSNVKNIFHLMEQITNIDEYHVYEYISYLLRNNHIKLNFDELYNIIKKICKKYNFTLCEYNEESDETDNIDIYYNGEEYYGDCIATFQSEDTFILCSYNNRGHYTYYYEF